MFVSLTARITAIGLIVLLALASLAGLLADASYQASQSVHWAAHSAGIIETTEAALGDLREAESGQRGFVITRDPAYARSYAERVDSAARTIARVVEQTDDNPLQHARAQEIAVLMKERSAILLQPLNLARRGDFSGAVAVIASGRGRELMDAISVRAQGFLDEERALQSTRQDAAVQRLESGKRLAILGAIAVALVVVGSFALLVRAIRRPLATMMRAMTALGSGEQDARIDTAMGSREFTRLAVGYNAMADRLRGAVADQGTSERQLQIVNTELEQNTKSLRERGEVIELLGGMAHRMQAARTDDELAQIIRVFVPQVLPDIPGALYAHNNSRNCLAPVASWGGITVPIEGFAPERCWALRRGQSHSVEDPSREIVCGHVAENEVYHCEPLLAGGEVIGVLYLQGRIGAENRFRMNVLTENIASALVNHRLQRSLREQTIRDPLTSLFNRRYMEETLKLEIARSSRAGTPLSLVMCDIDHFKRFNDEFGHDAGDSVLQMVAAEMRSRFRDGDVICRFGGEEFTIIAPGTTAEALAGRVETVRRAIAELAVRHGNRTLGSTSMSFGIATWSDAMDRDGATLIQAADMALYQSKRDGRNRATISMLAA
ncbi:MULTISPECIES: diguanylate cyclase [unclassified Sphingomonas]|uniref:diguanylate cyclase n=1 Tax=unclassified Sphingomonas TaxID=196159 RepID=UPI000FF39EED|nr:MULTISPECIES: diguanylate cyclase [unclassified Sphingomonas]RKE45923.1 diguanylate cyclase (GGDEF)-like protein [Sphingomonas sp. PP-CC-1A-547]TCM06872.1 diguanylate cyclase (GGDEF)-like protein [Sphingomonas sp. PP-CC-3G-468]